MTVKLRHVSTGAWLTALDKSYTHIGSSGQHIVGGGARQDESSKWLIKPAHDQRAVNRNGDPIRSGDTIRLEHVLTRRNLHSHDKLAPLTGVQGQQEVTAFASGGAGVGDILDNWLVFPESGNDWRSDSPFRLRHHNVGGRFLHSHGQANQTWTGSLFEVTTVNPGDANDLFECVVDESPVDAYGKKPHVKDQAEALRTLRKLCDKFETFLRQMNVRYDNRPKLYAITDEYDVQDVFHALLRLHFEDVRAEEVTPTVAGKSARMDFYLDDVRIAVETKMTRDSLARAQLIKELAEDRIRYQKYPQLEHLFCFVHDPARHCKNPVGAEKDLSDPRSFPLQQVVIRPH